MHPYDTYQTYAGERPLYTVKSFSFSLTVPAHLDAQYGPGAQLLSIKLPPVIEKVSILEELVPTEVQAGPPSPQVSLT